MRENQIKTRLLAGDLQLGCWLGAGSSVVSEIAGAAGFDWCMIDGEHAPFDAGAIRGQLRALEAAGCPAAVRVPCAQEWAIKQALDIGAQTVLVPMVDSGDQAAEIVATMKYPPQGRRGMGAGVIRASGYGADAGYAVTANDQICVMVQCESRASVTQIDAILASGVDCVFIGPGDLAADMGHVNDPNAPEVQEAIQEVLAKTRAAGVGAGFLWLAPDEVPKYRDMGANFIAVASDVVTIRQAMQAQLSAVKTALA